MRDQLRPTRRQELRAHAVQQCAFFSRAGHEQSRVAELAQPPQHRLHVGGARATDRSSHHKVQADVATLR